MLSFKNKNQQNEYNLSDYGYLRQQINKPFIYLKTKRSKSKQNILIAGSKSLNNFFKSTSQKNLRYSSNNNSQTLIKNKNINYPLIKQNQNIQVQKKLQLKKIAKESQQKQQLQNVYRNRGQNIQNKKNFQKYNAQLFNNQKQGNVRKMLNKKVSDSVVGQHFNNSQYYYGQKSIKYKEKNIFKRPLEQQYSSGKYNVWRKIKSRSQSDPKSIIKMTQSLVYNKNKKNQEIKNNQVEQKKSRIVNTKNLIRSNKKTSQNRIQKPINEYYNDKNFQASTRNSSQIKQKHKLQYTFGRHNAFLV